MIPGLLEGLNCTIFAYGPTGAGKTFTILGTNEKPGLMIHSVHDLMAQFDSGKFMSCSLRFSYIEVYNEVLRDLLVSQDKPIDIREDPEQGVVINGVSEVVTTSKKEIMTMIK